MKGTVVALVALAALVGVMALAGAGPLTIYGATGLGVMPDANVIPSMSATGQYTYADSEGGVDIYNVGAGWNGLEVVYTNFDDSGSTDWFSAKYQLDISKYDPEFDLPIKLAVGMSDLFDDFEFDNSWYVVGTYAYELGAPIVGDVIPTLEFSLGTGEDLYDDVFYGVKADLGDFAGWYEHLDVMDDDNWGLEYSPSALPALTVGYSDIESTDCYSVAYNLAF